MYVSKKTLWNIAISALLLLWLAASIRRQPSQVAAPLPATLPAPAEVRDVMQSIVAAQGASHEAEQEFAAGHVVNGKAALAECERHHQRALVALSNLKQ